MEGNEHMQQNVDAYKNQRSADARPGKFKLFQTLGSKLFLFFIVSMVTAVVAVGLISYAVSSRAMENKVSEVAAQSLQQTSEKLDYLLGFYENISLQLVLDQDFIGDLSYRLNLIKAGTTENRMNVEGRIANKLKQTATTNKVYIQLFDEEIYTQVDTGRDYVSALFSSGNGTAAISFYQPYFDAVVKGNGKAVWLGAIPKGEVGAETTYISMGKLLKSNGGNYLLFIEFKDEVIAQALANLQLSDGKLPELVNAAGELVYTDSPYIEQAVEQAANGGDDASGAAAGNEAGNITAGGETTGSANENAAADAAANGAEGTTADTAVSSAGDADAATTVLQRRTHGLYEVPADAEQSTGSYTSDKQLIVYSTSAHTGWSLVQSIPLSELTQGIEQIVTVTWVLIAGAIIISLLLGVVIARMISRPIKEVSALMKQVELGDLSVRMHSNRQDEIGALGQSFNQMADNVGALISRTSAALEYVLDSAQKLHIVSKKMDTSAREIAIATDEIARGADVLATQSEEGSAHAASIHHEMSSLMDNNEHMQQYAYRVMEGSNQGIVQMNTLLSKTSEGERLTRETMQRADKLVTRAAEIRKILDLLDNIAKNTNLLSLNAAIEASRAGEHGRGFMVVAQEVRQLADQSRESIVVVGQIINAIVEEIEGTVQAMNESYPIYQQQIAVANHVDAIFREVDQRMEQFMQNINETTASANKLHHAQTTLSEMILHVSATAEQSTAISQEVASTSTNQIAISSELVEVSQQLNDLSLELQNILAQFQVTKEEMA